MHSWNKIETNGLLLIVERGEIELCIQETVVVVGECRERKVDEKVNVEVYSDNDGKIMRLLILSLTWM